MNGEQSSGPSGRATVRPLRVPDPEELPPLLPRTALSIFDEAVRFLRIEPALLLGVTLIVLLPLRVLAAALPGSPLRDARPDELIDILVGNLDQPGGVLAAIVTIMFESIALFTVASIYAEVSSIWYSGRATTAADLLISSIKRSPALLVGWIIVHVLEVLGGFFTLMFGALLIGSFAIVTAPVMGAEDVGPWRAVRRSFSLTAPKLVHAFLVFVVSGVGAIAIRLALRFLPSLIGLELLDLPLWLVSGVADVVASVVTTSLVAATATVLYLDLRVRREGIDLYMAMSRAFGTDAVVGER